ncbi:hypothetical protein [Nocardioides sp. SLBN-35]|uniref:hypothetical protein n=1 Tax=Nocardioides sp. SLBN-35 TaxID=2768445 RepID=UPI00114F00F1|nr:hypothetical protein [Nocardioides sp. SLBN-35]TQK68641.1 hypothetical protein FBY23_0394 [Nocardioides sp. SLBN-35]
MGSHVRSALPWLALAGALGLIAAAILVPLSTGWDVHARSARYPMSRTLPPWHGEWMPRLGPGTAPALLLAVLGIGYGPALARRLGNGALLLASYAGALCWLLALATVDGTDGLSRVLGHRSEYLRTARSVTDIGALLHTYVARIPLDAPDHWPVHVAGHPPGMVLFFVGLDRIGLGGDLAAGVVVTAVAASIAPAVLLTLRILGEETTARRVAPFVVLTPAAVTMAVSADAVMAAVAAWAMVCLALATRPTRWAVAWALSSGLLFGCLVMMSYGLPVFGVVALGLLAGRRSWRPLVPCALAAAAVVLGFAVAGFAWWEAFPVLVDRYWAGIATQRPASYWVWGNVAVLLATAGPLVSAGLARAPDLPRASRAITLAAVTAITLASISMMSKAEVERIWLPFVPWLTLSVAALPDRWLRWGLALQVATALLVEHLVATFW